MKKKAAKKEASRRAPGRFRAVGALKKWFVDEKKAPRRWAVLALALAAVLAAAWAVPLGLTALFQWLFSVWGVTSASVARAPGWVQALYGGWLYVNGFVQGGAISLAAWFTGRALNARVRVGKGFLPGLAAGALSAGLLIAAFRLLDVMRFGRALSSPALSWLTPMLLLYGIAQALGAVLATGLIGEAFSRWHRLLALAGSACAYALLFGRWTPIGLAAGALFGAATWLSREKNGGVASAFGFLCAFSVLTVAIFGMPPWQQGAPYETYPVSKPWLTGGDAGPWAGLALVFLLIAITAALALQSRRAKAAPPERPARPRQAGES